MRLLTLRSWRAALRAPALTAILLGCASAGLNFGGSSPIVGSPKGSVMVVGGGSMGPELYAKFIELAGGPDGLIVVIPTSGGTTARYDSATSSSVRSFRNYGAKHVAYLHSFDRKLTDTDSFAAVLKKATGVWFDGGRQWNLADAYGGTKTEREFMAVYQRGGVVGGSSAGASILGSYMWRGARSGNTVLMDPTYGDKGFGYLRGVAIDQHVVARSRLADMGDTLVARLPNLLGISEDEGTAWVVQGDKAVIMGRNKAFVYNGKEKDEGHPFLTLHPGDTYDLGKRALIKRALDATPLTEKIVDDAFGALPFTSKATVLVAQDGKVLINKSYRVPANAKYMPTTTLPQFPLGGLSIAYHSVLAQIAASTNRLSLDDRIADGSPITLRQYFATPSLFAANAKPFADLYGKKAGSAFAASVTQRISTPTGAHYQTASADGMIQSNVDELYRLDLGLTAGTTFLRDTSGTPALGNARSLDATLGWTGDQYKGTKRYTLVSGLRGQGHVYVRIPEKKMSVIILSTADDASVKAIAEKITDRLMK